MTLDPERRSALRGAKLRVLVAEVGGPDFDPEACAVDGDHLFDGSRLWTLASEEAPETVLGTAVLRAGRHGTSDAPVPVSLLVDDPTVAATVARRAAVLDVPPDVFQVDGRRLVAAEPAGDPAGPVELPAPDGFDDLCRGVGVEPLLEHGIWRGEVLGLEVVRVVPAGETDSAPGADGAPVVQVGVGRFDREAGAIMQGSRTDSEVLAAAADLVRAQRRTGAGAPPLATLGRERWLRRDLCAAPGMVGLVDLVPVDPADERLNLRDPSPAPAVGSDADGGRVLVVCSVGVDPRMLGAVCELVLRERPDRVVVALPVRDVLRPVERALTRLRIPTSVVGVPCGWDRN
ncbi:MAG: hypothetical protein VYC56_03165 [Actinomycetota bacterium]|nr:hypothetical protein [Actinomycetota bacterium]